VDKAIIGIFNFLKEAVSKVPDSLFLFGYLMGKFFVQTILKGFILLLRQPLFVYMHLFLRYCAIVFLIFAGCKTNTDAHKSIQTTVFVNVFTARHEKAYLIKLAYNNEPTVVADSQTIISAKDTLIFRVPFEPGRQYKIEISGSHKAFNFIPDAKEIRITFNNINGACIINGSAASNSLKTFKEVQLALADSIAEIDKDSNLSGNKKEQVTGPLLKTINQNNYNYADTVSNVAAFVDVFGLINFDKNYNGLKNFTERAVKRFPGNKEVLLIRKQSLDMIDIYEKEYLVGQTLPPVSLPDNVGNMFSTSSLKGSYYLINFWATWYPKTYSCIEASQNVLNNYAAGNLKIVNVALDDDKENWSRIIKASGSTAINLIDSAMWHGTAANTLKFDSIPFNFLVDPNGIIIGKAIKPDSLALVLRQKLH
jgi:AhpC/TSA family